MRLVCSMSHICQTGSSTRHPVDCMWMREHESTKAELVPTPCSVYMKSIYKDLPRLIDVLIMEEVWK